MLPPLVVRRLVLAPSVVVLTVLAFTGLPVLLLVAAAASTVLPGRWRPLRLLWMVLLYLVLESVALVVLFALWVASGFGWRIRSPRFQRAHYAIVRWYLQVLFWECRRVLHVRVDVEGPPPTSYDGRPLLILSRHAGPGDSFLVVHALVNWYAREPRIVLKDTLQWDPAIDVVLNRLPNRFIRPEPGRNGDLVERQVGRAVAQPRRERRLRHLPRGRQLHRAPAQARDRTVAAQGAHRRGRARRAAAARDGSQARRGAGRADQCQRCRRRLRRAHRHRTHGHRPRRVARAADGHRHRDALVARAGGRCPEGPRGAHRLALRLVEADRRLDRRAPRLGVAAP